MTRAEAIQRKRRRYLANILSEFENEIESLIPDGNGPAVEHFKGIVRAKLNALAVDSIEILGLKDGDPVRLNADAQDLRDRIAARPATRSN